MAGKTFTYNKDIENIDVGNYSLLVKTIDGCLSKLLSITLPYDNCNYVVQSGLGHYLELNIAEEEDSPLEIKIRDAKSGIMVYQDELFSGERFIWRGIDDNNRAVVMGNYVYIISSNKKPLIATGQITVLR